MNTRGGDRAPEPLSVAIVGLGPRGLSVLERLVIRLRGTASRGTGARGDVVIWAVDAVEHGAGRIWRSTQPSWLAANATAAELTAHSPDSHLLTEVDAARPYSLAEWMPQDEHGDVMRSGDYPSRRRYGSYLHDVFGQLCRTAPPNVHIRPLLGHATRLRRSSDGLRLTVDSLPELRVDKAVIATGHSRLDASREEQDLRRHAARQPGLRYIGRDIAADMPLDAIPAGSTVAVQGLGLTFYDVARSLSLGRGGRFTRDGVGRLRYRPSGREPRLVAGSRSALPFLARALTGDQAELAPRPFVLTERRIERLRAVALARRASPQLDFAAEIEPLITLEMNHAYYECAVRVRDGHRAAARFSEAFREVVDDQGVIDPHRETRVLSEHDVSELPPVRLHELADPFAGATFGSSADFRQRLADLLAANVVQAGQGMNDPVNAALEVLRNLRPALPGIVDFGGLLPGSQQDFLTRFVPAHFRLSAGPPASHVEQLVALLDAGIVEIAGPAARFTVDADTGCFAVESPRVAGSRRLAQVLLDARTPEPDLRRDVNPLLRGLVADGMAVEYVNRDPGSGEEFDTGGLAVTRAPFRVVDAHGDAHPDIYAIGVVTQNTRWFTQVGTGRPGQDSPFCRDADAIALDVLSPASATTGTGSAGTAQAGAVTT